MARDWQKRLRLAGWIYLTLFILTLLTFFYAATNSGQPTSGGIDLDDLALISGGLFLLLLVIGSVAVIVVSFMKQHTVVAVVGAISLAFMMMSLLASMSPNDPTGGMAFGMSLPFFLLGLGFPVVGAIRRAKPGSSWEKRFPTGGLITVTPPTSV